MATTKKRTVRSIHSTPQRIAALDCVEMRDLEKSIADLTVSAIMVHYKQLVLFYGSEEAAVIGYHSDGKLYTKISNRIARLLANKTIAHANARMIFNDLMTRLALIILHRKEKKPPGD